MPLSNFGALIVVDPEEAKRRILRAFEESEGSRSGAAQAMDVPERTLYHWISKLQMEADIDRVCAENGFEVHRGAPRKAPSAKK